MKRNIISTFLAAFILSAFIQACQKMEPSTYTETFYRVATVQYKNEKASLLIDYTGEKFNFSNFSTASDMRYFNVKDGDRAIVSMTLTAIGNITNNELSIDAFYKFPVDSLAKQRPASTLNYDCQFNVFYLFELKYPAIWSQGHFVNIAPIYYIPNEKCKADFYLYPLDVKDDTLQMRLYSDIPENDLSIRGYSSASQSLLCYDISSLRDSVPDPAEQAHRKDILKKLKNLNRDSIMVHIFQPDTLRGNIEGIYYERYPRLSVSISIPFDF